MKSGAHSVSQNMYAKTYRFRLKQALIHLCQLVDIGNPVVGTFDIKSPPGQCSGRTLPTFEADETFKVPRAVTEFIYECGPVVVPGSLPDGQVNVVTEYFRKALYIFPVDT
ncbi:hypothetical protein MAALD49_02810 [Marinobacter shengliensis]|nr:hypothetical protein MAALD49_02810 [Marinobacter shengliensis]